MTRPTTFWRIGAILSLLLVGAASAVAQNDRIVLIEEFTSLTCTPCVQATGVLNEILAANPGRVISIRHHLNIPLPNDPFYKANPTDADARKNFYGLSGIPYARVDGEFVVDPRKKSEVQTRVTGELAASSTASIKVTQRPDDATPGQMNVSVEIQSGSEPLTGLRLRVAAVEAYINDPSVRDLNLPGYNGETEFFDVMRDLVPSSEGELLTHPANTKKTYNYTYMIGAGWKPEQMYSIAYIQDPFDTRILQAGFSPRPVNSVRVVGKPLAGYSLEESRPNPAANIATLGYTIAAPQNVELAIYNLSGELVARFDQGMRAAGTHDARLDLATLPAGSYTVSITAGEFRAATKLNVVK
jgi:hypothetical protein